MGERTEADAGGMVQTVIVIGKDISYAVRSTENLPSKDIGLSRNKNIDRLLTPKPSLDSLFLSLFPGSISFSAISTTVCIL